MADAQPRLLALEPGMRWTYRASGSLQPSPDAPPLPMAGTITITIDTLEFRGKPTPALTFAQDLRPLLAPTAAAASPPVSVFGAGAPPVGIFYLRQDPQTRDVYFIGDNQAPPGTPGAAPGTRTALGTGGLFIPGGWRDGVSYTKRIDWEGGSWTHNWLAVLGTDVIETGVGPRAAWRAPNRSESAEGVAIDGTDWWAPELGQPVQFDVNTRLSNGAIIRLRAVLESTNVVAR